MKKIYCINGRLLLIIEIMLVKLKKKLFIFLCIENIWDIMNIFILICSGNINVVILIIKM